MKKIPPRVGFDLDGVLLYNPARAFRPLALSFSKKIRNKQGDNPQFYVPKKPFEIFIWRIVHWSSMWIARGLADIKRLSKNKDITSYIITSRYDCLKKDFAFWLRKMDAKSYFNDTFHNKNNEQPHEFKERMINKLQLDYFVEDNWNIVNYLQKRTKAQILWISNPLDKHIPYKYTFFTLQDAVTYIQESVLSNGKKQK